MDNIEEQEDDLLPELMRFNNEDDIPEEYVDHVRSVELDGRVWISPGLPTYAPAAPHILEVSGQRVILETDSWVDYSTPVILPEVFPTEQAVYSMLLEAVRKCVSSNMLRPMSRIVYPVIRDKADVFNDSIAFREIGMDGSLELFSGRIPVQQFLGKVLHDDEVILAFLGYPVNSVVNSKSMRNTRVTYNSSTDPDIHRVSVVHKMPRSDLAIRYLGNTDARIHEDGDFMYVTLDIDFDHYNMDGLMTAARLLGPSLHIYFKLLTRFPSCQSYQTSLPTFRIS